MATLPAKLQRRILHEVLRAWLRMYLDAAYHDLKRLPFYVNLIKNKDGVRVAGYNGKLNCHRCPKVVRMGFQVELAGITQVSPLWSSIALFELRRILKDVSTVGVGSPLTRYLKEESLRAAVARLDVNWSMFLGIDGACSPEKDRKVLRTWRDAEMTLQEAVDSLTPAKPVPILPLEIHGQIISEMLQPQWRRVIATDDTTCPYSSLDWQVPFRGCLLNKRRVALGEELPFLCKGHSGSFDCQKCRHSRLKALQSLTCRTASVSPLWCSETIRQTQLMLSTAKHARSDFEAARRD